MTLDVERSTLDTRRCSSATSLPHAADLDLDLLCSRGFLGCGADPQSRCWAGQVDCGLRMTPLVSHLSSCRSPRTLSSSLPTSAPLTPSLIIGPAFYSAWAYTVLGYCITRLGPSYSLLKPRMYLAVFISADVASLVLQAIGGGKAAVAAENGLDTTLSTHISELGRSPPAVTAGHALRQIYSSLGLIVPRIDEP